MIAVVETSAGGVLQVVLKTTQEQAEIVAKELCQENGIQFEGDVSCDGNVREYSVQIATCTGELT